MGIVGLSYFSDEVKRLPRVSLIAKLHILFSMAFSIFDVAYKGMLNST